jgi:integrase
MTRVKLSAKPLAAPPTVLSPDQIRKLLEALEEPFRSIVTVAVLSGLRRGELFALRWGCVDLVQKFLTVRESIYMGRISTPKTRSSVRRIPLSAPLAELFEKLKARSQHARDEDFVFSSRCGTSLHPDHILKRVIQPTCERLMLPRIGWHTFRHVHATLLSVSGESIKTAQSILGHSDLETTLQVYTHPIPEAERRAEEKLAEMVLDPNGPKSVNLEEMEPAGNGWIN